ncbi:MAG: riboflavin biosynthesis protein RibF, partial [Candidatus Omnitrophica bacterium]|nr:riboflavin biosynthesis protein RibF [Candidatus Omnitrophota bacterium]
TFYPHPSKVLGLSEGAPLLTSLEHRLRLFDELGVDCALVLRFTRTLSSMKAADFINNVLGRIRIYEIIQGSNFFFGKDKSGTLRDLEKFSHSYGYHLTVVKTFNSSGKIISSTWIRNLIMKGELKKASFLLSRSVTILGTVKPGSKRGRLLGYPTANIDPHHEAIPPSGVYASKVRVGNRIYKGVLNIGTRPTFKKDSLSECESTVEVHIFNFKRSIYGKDVEISFAKRIRREKKFKSRASLIRQIRLDEKKAKKILAE